MTITIYLWIDRLTNQSYDLSGTFLGPPTPWRRAWFDTATWRPKTRFRQNEWTSTFSPAEEGAMEHWTLSYISPFPQTPGIAVNIFLKYLWWSLGSGKMWIQIRTIDGKETRTIEDLSRLTRIESLRLKIQDIFNVNPEQQRLFYRGKQVSAHYHL